MGVCVGVVLFQAEIDRMFKTEELAREHRQSLLKQHEQIAKMQEEVQSDGARCVFWPVHTCLHTHACMHTHMHTCMHAHMHSCTHIHAHTLLLAHTLM